MRLLLKIVLTFAVGAFCFNALCLAEQTAKTEKIKIISACCINNKWTFRIYDGVSGESFSLKLGKQNAKGWKLEDFNTKTQVAHIKTPRGNFEIQMQEAKLAQVTQETETLETTATPQELANEADLEPIAQHKIFSRKQILRNIK